MKKSDFIPIKLFFSSKTTKICIVIYLFAYSLCYATEDRYQRAKPQKNPIVESFNPEIKVSGNVIVGVMASKASTGLKNDALAISRAASSKGKEVCLQVTSIDGTYTSRNTYFFDPETTKDISLPYESVYKSVVESFNENNAAMIATSGSCDETSSDYYLLYLQNDKNFQENIGQTTIYINGFDATDVSIDSDNSVQDCKKSEEPKRTTFNFECTIGIKPEASEDLDITILRERYGRELPSVNIRLLGAAGKSS